MSALLINPAAAKASPSPTTVGGAASNGGALIKDITLATFMVDVIEASKQNPVIVDFWAPWCGPCKQLTPILEKFVTAAKGAVTMARVDIDRDPQIAQQLGVQSIPAVFAFYRGQPVDGFMGAVPEAQAKAWMDRLIKATGATALHDEAAGLETALQQAADFLAAGDVATAQSIYADIAEMVPDNAAAYAGLVRCLLAAGDLEQAGELLTQATPELAKSSEVLAVKSAWELAQQAQGVLGAAAELQNCLQKDANDHAARYDLALAYYASNNREAAVDELLEIIRRNRGWNEEAARKQLVKLFEAFGHTDPLTISARKRLSSILFA